MTQSMPAPCALRRGARVTSVTVSDVCVVCCRASSRLPCDLRVSVRDASTRTHCKIDTQRTQDSIGKFAFGDQTIPIHADARTQCHTWCVSLCHRMHGKRIPQTARGAGRAPAGRPLETVRRVLGQASRLPYSVQLYRASVSVPTTLYPTPPVFLTGPG